VCVKGFITFEERLLLYQNSFLRFSECRGQVRDFQSFYKRKMKLPERYF